jgi:FkbM family methyltransferase
MTIFSFTYENVDYTFHGDPNMHFIKVIKGLNSFYELNFLKYIQSLKLDGIYIDGGCFVGNHSIFFANYCESDAVYCVDADNDFENLFNKNCASNLFNKDKVQYFNYALMGKEGYVDLNGDPSPNKLQCTDVKDLKVKESGDVLAKTLDSAFIELIGDKKLGFIKLDIEGCELQALQGGLELLKKHKPVIAVEAWHISEQVAIKNLLSKFGYSLIKQIAEGAPMLVFRCENEL